MLLKSAENGDFEAVKKAIELGADINTTNFKGKTAMILTVNTKNGYEIVKFLLEKGADVLKKDKNKKNVLDYLIMPEEPPLNHENAHEAWIYAPEHFFSSLIKKAMKEQSK